MSPSTNIDGTEITGATIDGQDVQEITVDGDTVFTAIPDEGDLHARYDATEISASDGDAISTWTDQTGNGYDLTAGSAPTYRASEINGNPALEFTSNYLDTAFTALSQPNSIFMVFRHRTTGGDRFAHGSESGGTNSHLFNAEENGNFAMFAGSYVEGTATDTNAHIMSELYNTTSSVIRRDGAQTGSGDAGSLGLDGFTIGSSFDQFESAPIDVGEILIYPQDKSGIAADVESYLSDKWGITI